MRTLVSIGLVALLCGVGGCGSNADSLIKDRINTMNELADALENKAPEAKCKEIAQKLTDIDKKLEELKLSDDEKKKLLERHKDDLTKAAVRLTDAMAKAGMNDLLGQMGKAFGQGGFGQGFPGGGMLNADGAQQRVAIQQSPEYSAPVGGPSFQKGPGDSGIDKRPEPSGPIPMNKWDVKALETVYNIKLTKISYDGNRNFTLTFQFTEDDVQNKVTRGKLKSKFVFFDVENIVAAHGQVGDFQTDVTGKKGQGFRCTVIVDGDYDAASRAVRVEVQSVEEPKPEK